MSEPTQHALLAEARRVHNRRLEQLRSEYAPSRALNEELVRHERHVSQILGPDDQPCIGSGQRYT